MSNDTPNNHEKLADGTKVYRMPGPKGRGPKLRMLREKAQVNMRDLARVCGIDFSQVSRYESGDVSLSPQRYCDLLDGIEKIKQEKERRAHVQAIADELVPKRGSLHAALGMPLAPEEQELLTHVIASRVYRPENSGIYWVRFSVNGRTYEESAATESHSEAIDFLRKRIKDELRERREQELREARAKQEQRKRRVAALDELGMNLEKYTPSFYIYRPEDSQNYWIKFSLNGHTYQENANTESRDEAARFLMRRAADKFIELREQEARQLAVLENLESVDGPIISELIESFRREIAEKDALLEEMSRALEKSAGD